MRSRLAFACSTAAVVLTAALAACDTPDDVQGPADSASLATAVADVRISDALKDLRNATARFNSQEQAIKAGYEPTSHCVEHPVLGGMGQHWANPQIIDPVYDPANPEVVLYAPDENGQWRLAAVEFVVLNVGQPRPSFDGQPLDIGGAPIPVPHWTLHIWLYENNPAGVFTPFNPTVSCTH